MNAVCKRIAEEHEAKEARERKFLRYPLELSDLRKFPDRASRKETIPDVDDEPQNDDAWIVAAFERFDRPEINEGGHHLREEWNGKEYPNVDGLPIRGKRFTARSENPKCEALGSEQPDGDFAKRLARIDGWENEHLPGREPFKLEELQATDYKKIYCGSGGASRYTDIKIEQIKLGSVSEDLWLKYRRIEGAYHRIWSEAVKEGRKPIEYRPLSQYPYYHDSLIQLRSRISKMTGLNYRTVDRGLNYMLKKRIIRDLRQLEMYRCERAAHKQGWDRAPLWQCECHRVVESRQERGKDWIRGDPTCWQDADYLTPEDGDSGLRELKDMSWHCRRYMKEHQTFI